MTDNRSVYNRPLASSSREIRIIVLEAGADPAHIQCHLEYASLNDSPEYQALSYAWGSPQDLSQVFVGQVALAVTKNLNAALICLRHPTQDRRLWIDAICINQSDIGERNAQVAFMGDIYRCASQVLLWIGEADNASDRALDLMCGIDVDSIHSPQASLVWQFYCQALNRAYMTRLWIVQELVLATADPVVVCGRKQVPWSIFMSAYRLLSTEFFTQIDMAKETQQGAAPQVLAKLRYDTYDDLRAEVQRSGGADLRQLLIASRSLLATEPRDRIYGLLQMLDADDRTQFTVDYRLPVSNLFAQAIALIFKQGDGPRFLASVWCPASPNPDIPDLPSWVPDFTRQTSQLAGTVAFPVNFHPAFPSSASGVGADADNGTVMDDLKTLKVSALHVDVIEDVVLFPDTLEECIAQFKNIEQRVANAIARHILDESLRPFIQRFRRAEPLWRVLVSNGKHGSGYHVAPDSYEAAYNDIRSGAISYTGLSKHEYGLALQSHVPGRAFFTTKFGFWGVGVPTMQANDEITIWFGANVPFVVRQVRSAVELGLPDMACRLIGSAYVAGIMQGELVDELYCDDLIDAKTLQVV